MGDAQGFQACYGHMPTIRPSETVPTEPFQGKPHNFWQKAL